MNRVVLVFVAVVAFLCVPTYAQGTQTSTFSVHVLRGGTSEPIAGAVVTVDGIERRTNTVGVATFENFAFAGDTMATVQKAGYQFGALTILASNPAETQYRIELGLAEKLPRRRKR